MKICRFDDTRLGLVEGRTVWDVTAAAAALPKVCWPLPAGDLFFTHFDRMRAAIEAEAKSARSVTLDHIRLNSPVANPGKIIAAPVNYQLHLDESRADSAINFGGQVKTIDEYGLFLKANSSLIGAGDAVVVSRPDRRTDHEIELALVIGKPARNVAEADALDHVAGYTIGLDMTIRGTEDRSYRKSLDTFTLLGPWLVTPDEFGNPSDADFEIKVNGKTRQKANTRDLIFSVPKLISYASHAYTLQPGDVILTGTPDGVGPVQPGDIMECWIDRIGAMKISVTGV